MRIFFRKDIMRLSVDGVGRLVKDPIITDSQDGKTKIAKFTIACNFTKDESCFYYCISYGQTAEFVAKYFKKGKPIHISGEWGQYTSDKDSKKHSYVEVRKVDFVPSDSTSKKEVPDSEDDDDVPF